MERLSLKELQNEELKILESTASFLDSHNLNYFLACGTLLGAVRHKGFIPWDDDIDITMPRPDYDKLVQLVANGKTLPAGLILNELSLKNTKLPFAKVINPKIEIKSLSKEDKYLWIDIFVIDGLPNSQDEIVKHYKKERFQMGLIYLKTNSFKDIMKEHKSILNRLVKVCLKPIAMLVPIKYSSKKIIKLAKKYNYNKSKYVGVYIWGDGPQEKMLKKDIANYKISFEGKKFNTYKNYEKYLKSIFGDYMQLPPEEDRKDHNIEAYKVG